MSRRTARLHAFHLIFQLPFYNGDERSEAYINYLNLFLKDDPAELRELFQTPYFSPSASEADLAFITDEYNGVLSHLGDLDEQIGKNAIGWGVDRINKVDLAIMRLAAYEILFDEKTPTLVSINEAIEIAKLYSDDDAPGFINGVLGSIGGLDN